MSSYNNINRIIDDYLIDELKMLKILDESLNNLEGKSYFIDKENKKYIFCLSIFNSIEDLKNKWEEYQNEDIVLNLQSKKYFDNDIKWDIYYILGCNEDIYIKPELITNIENDKFSCKKVIINCKDRDEIIYQLKEKLPIVNDYYKLKELNITDDEYFWEKVLINLDNNGLNYDKDIINSIISGIRGEKVE